MRKILILAVLAVLFGYTVYDQMKQSQLQTQAPQQNQGIVQTNTAADQSNQATPENQSASQSQSSGKPAVPFSLKGLDGKTYHFSGPREKPLVINFWASWCGPCREEAPDLKKLYEIYKGKIDLYAVNLTSQDNLKDVNAFVSEYQFAFPILLDEKGEVADSYKIQAIPTTFFIDKKGVIQQTVIGMIDPSMLDQYLKKIMP